MTTLTNFQKNGFYYQLVDRKGDWVIFRQSTRPDSKAPFNVGMAWEVFKIKVSKYAEWLVTDKEGNKTLLKVEPKECAPGDNDFGHSAFSCHTLKRAYQKLEECIQNEAENKLRRENKLSQKQK